jgi:PAS domain S-box-containing protein
MKDEEKTKEQLIEELTEIRKHVEKLELSSNECRKAAEELKMLKKALETMQLGVTISDFEGRILYINPAELDMHGYTVEELKDMHVRIFAPNNLWKPMTKEKITSMKRWKRESINKRKDGKTFPVQLMSDIVTNEEGEPAGIVTTCEDITGRKKMEREIKSRIEELEKFYEMSVVRELKMKELKKKIKEMEYEISKDNEMNRPGNLLGN